MQFQSRKNITEATDYDALHVLQLTLQLDSELVWQLARTHQQQKPRQTMRQIVLPIFRHPIHLPVCNWIWIIAKGCTVVKETSKISRRSSMRIILQLLIKGLLTRRCISQILHPIPPASQERNCVKMSRMLNAQSLNANVTDHECTANCFQAVQNPKRSCRIVQSRWRVFSQVSTSDSLKFFDKDNK